MDVTIVQDKKDLGYIYVAVESEKPHTLWSEMLHPARLAIEEWGQENGYGSVIPYFEELAGGNDFISVFHTSFISFTKIHVLTTELRVGHYIILDSAIATVKSKVESPGGYLMTIKFSDGITLDVQAGPEQIWPVKV